MPPTKPTEQSSSEKTKLQKFEYREIKRSTIKTADYNPRSISRLARKRLKKKIDEVGCVEPLVWNEVTGRLVGGHQRLAIIDQAEGWPENDYTIGVAVVRLKAKQEKALNIFLNNAGAQGQFEGESFVELVKEAKLSLEDIGFSKVDLELEFGELPDMDSIFGGDRSSADSTAERLRKIKDRKKQARRETAHTETGPSPTEDADYYLLIAFNSYKDKAKWMKERGIDENQKVLSAEEFFSLEIDK